MRLRHSSPYRSCPATRCLIAGIWLGFAPALGLAAPAARVEFAVGGVSATSPTGQTRLLAKGAAVDNGDTVNTHDGRVQLRFTDGAYVSLQPQTLFRIDDYRYDGKSDGNERGFFSLLKGGLRTITGLVGRTNKRTYQVSTTVATIGIRGTEYTLAYTNSVSGSVGEGQIDVCNSAGCQPVTSGQSFFVASNSVKPEITTRKTDLPPSQPAGATPSFISGDKTSQSGDLNLFVLTGTQSLSLVTAGISGFQPATTVVLDQSGAVTQFDSCGDACIVTFPSGLKGFGNDGTVAWGRGMSQDASGGLFYTHYVTGLPTSPSDLGALVANNVVATYSLLGGTVPTADAAPGQMPFALGTVQSAGLTVNFGLSRASANVTVNMNGLTFLTSATDMKVNGNLFDKATDGSTTFSCSVAGGSCTLAYMAGLVAGPKANRAALVYDVSTSALGSSTAGCTSVCNGASIKGAVAFERKP